MMSNNIYHFFLPRRPALPLAWVYN